MCRKLNRDQDGADNGCGHKKGPEKPDMLTQLALLLHDYAMPIGILPPVAMLSVSLHRGSSAAADIYRGTGTARDMLVFDHTVLSVPLMFSWVFLVILLLWLSERHLVQKGWLESSKISICKESIGKADVPTRILAFLCSEVNFPYTKLNNR